MTEQTIDIEDAIEAAAKVYKGKSPFETYNLSDLQAQQFDPIKWIIPGTLPEGLTILAGAPKVGKSWLALDLLYAVATGGKAIGAIPCGQGTALYLALEDNPRRMQSRMRMMHLGDVWPEGAQLAHSCGKLGQGLEDAIETWLDQHNDARLIIIDTLKYVRASQSDNGSAYDHDYESLTRLQHLAINRGVGIVLIHHTRKMDAEDPFHTVSGSTALTGCADTTIVLHKGGDGVSLYGRGRDVEEFKKAIQFNKTGCQWTLLGDAHEVHRSDERKSILEVLKEDPGGDGMRPQEVADLAGMNSTACRKLMGKMARDGDVHKVKYGIYCHPDHVQLETVPAETQEVVTPVTPVTLPRKVSKNKELDDDKSVTDSKGKITPDKAVTNQQNEGHTSDGPEAAETLNTSVNCDSVTGVTGGSDG